MPASGDEPDLLASARLLAHVFCNRYAVPYWMRPQVYGDAHVVVVQLLARHDPDRSSWKSYLLGKGIWLLVDELRRNTGGRLRHNRHLLPTPTDVEILALLIPAQRDGSEDVVERLDQEALLERVRAELARMPPREAYVVVEHFLRGRQLIDIAADLHLTQSRISQIKGQALRHLRVHLSQ